MLDIIAEIGINHDGNIDTAIKLIKDAKKAGATAVKFQTFFIEELARQHTPKSDFQMRDKSSNSHIEMLKRCQLSYADHEVLINYCKKIDIEFISTPYHPSAVDLLEKIGVKRYKIASADIRDVFLVEAVIQTRKDIILSTGMADQDTVKKAIDYITNNKDFNDQNLTLLHCTSDYPCENKDANLNFISFLRNFNTIVGFSDHSVGSIQSLIALGLGAKVFEKHLTYDNNATGPDHAASCDFKQFKNYILKLNEGFKALGSSKKTTLQAEESMKYTSQKSLVYSSDLLKGTILKKNNFLAMRPLDGLEPYRFKEFVGRRLTKSVKKHENLGEEHFE